MLRHPQNSRLLFIIVLLASTLGLGLPSVATAGEFNRVLDLGVVAPKWTELPGTDGKQHSFDDFSEAKILVVAFTCNSCPYAVDVQQRLVAVQTWLEERGGQLVAINVNKVDQDLLPKMKERAADAGFNFPYLFDETQQIAKDYGATTTPEFFVLDAERKVRYMGSLDDSPDGKSVDAEYLRDAVGAVLAEEKVVKGETVPIGCRIRFERTRRPR